MRNLLRRITMRKPGLEPGRVAPLDPKGTPTPGRAHLNGSRYEPVGARKFGTAPQESTYQSTSARALAGADLVYARPDLALVAWRWLA